MSTHAEIAAAIEASGGYVVASFVLDRHGRTIGAVGDDGVRIYHCSVCGERGHSARRCQGEGLPPRPVHSRRPKPAPGEAAAKPCPKCGELGHDARRHNSGGGPRHTEPER